MNRNFSSCLKSRSFRKRNKHSWISAMFQEPIFCISTYVNIFNLSVSQILHFQYTDSHSLKGKTRAMWLSPLHYCHSSGLPTWWLETASPLLLLFLLVWLPWCFAIVTKPLFYSLLFSSTVGSLFKSREGLHMVIWLFSLQICFYLWIYFPTYLSNTTTAVPHGKILFLTPWAGLSHSHHSSSFQQISAIFFSG